MVEQWAMKEEQRILRATAVVTGGTFLSRVLGLIRDVVISGIFGAGPWADAFFVAFAIPNFFRRLMGEGSLTVAFVPVYTDYLTRDPAEAKKALRAVGTATVMVLLLFTIGGVLGAPWLVKLQVFGWRSKEAMPLAVELTRICFPYLFFISLVALAMGVLNAHGHFAAPALAPCLLNLSLIASALLLAPYFDPPVKALAWGVVAGGVLQLALQVPFLRKEGVSLKPLLDLRHRAVLRVGTLMLPMVAGIALFQINQVVNRLLASFLPHGSISYLYYADRLFELPLGLFAVAIGVAALPSFSRHAARGRWEELRSDVDFSLRTIFFISLPAMVAIIVLRIPLVGTIFQHGAFGPKETVFTAQALLAYAVSIGAYGGIHVLSRAFYAMQDARTPVKGAALGAVVNLGAGLILMHPLRHAGLALANSLAAFANMTFLFFLLKKRISLQVHPLMRALVRTALASLAMLPWLLWMMTKVDWMATGDYGKKALLLSATVMGGGVIFLGTSFLLRSEELKALVVGVLRRPPEAPRE